MFRRIKLTAIIPNTSFSVLLFLFSFFYFHGYSQNLVLNPGFEEYDSIFYQNSYVLNIKCWNGDFPFDFFSFRHLFSGIPENDPFYAKLNNYIKPKSGKYMEKIIVYNGVDRTSYFVGKLSNSLIKGKSYYIEFWYVSDYYGSAASNNLGVYFFDTIPKVKTNQDVYNITPDVNANCILKTGIAQWKKFSACFVARSNATGFIMGNFKGANGVKFEYIENPNNYEGKQEHLKQIKGKINSSYYIDDIKVALMSTPCDTSNNCDSTFSNLKTGKSIALRNIYFETAKSNLLIQSFIELDKLVKALQEQVSIKIEIDGYTDNTGNDQYNQTLSLKRAMAVSNYLVSNGIPQSRIIYKGFGSLNPVGDNQKEEGRAKNRRIEIKISGN